MINDTTTSFTKLKQFLEESSDLKELDLQDLIDLETDIKGSSNSSVNIKPLTISNPQINSINLSNLGNQPYRLNGNNLISLTIPQINVIYDNPNSSYTIGNLGTNYRSAFITKTKLQELVMPNFLGTPASIITGGMQGFTMTSAADYISFFGNYWLQDISFGNPLMKIDDANYSFNGNWFYNNYSIRALHLNYPYPIELIGSTGLQFSSLYGDGKGIIYVPNQELKDKYITAANWVNFASHFKLESEYAADAKLFQDSIEDSWQTIVSNPDKYKIGQTKTFLTNNIPIQMKIIGKNTDITPNGTQISTTWAPTTISYFTPVQLQNVYSNTAEHSYNTETSLKNVLEQIFEGIDNSYLKNAIKTVRKRCLGLDNSQTYSASLIFDGKIWPFSRAEFGIDSRTSSDPAYDSDYFTQSYKLGATAFTTYNSNQVAIPLRDISGDGTGDLDALEWNSAGTQMASLRTAINSNKQVFPIFGFCI